MIVKMAGVIISMGATRKLRTEVAQKIKIDRRIGEMTHR